MLSTVANGHREPANVSDLTRAAMSDAMTTDVFFTLAVDDSEIPLSLEIAAQFTGQPGAFVLHEASICNVTLWLDPKQGVGADCYEDCTAWFREYLSREPDPVVNVPRTRVRGGRIVHETEDVRLSELLAEQYESDCAARAEAMAGVP